MKIADVFAVAAGPDARVNFTAFDGSRRVVAAPVATMHIRSERGAGLLASAPGQLGLARAYVAGELQVDGDLFETLVQLSGVTEQHLSVVDRIKVARTLAPYALRRESPPPQEVKLAGRRHSKRRDSVAIEHHYDVSNRFYSWVLGPSMAYTCAVFPTWDSTLEQAQEEKFDLVCRKLGLQPGMRLLDVGCGWGGMVLHAVKNYGVSAVGVTLSAQQAEWGQQAIADAGLGDRAEIRRSDYRDIRETGFDALSSIGLTEHIGRPNYADYFEFLYSKLRPPGRLLNHSIMRPNDVGRTFYGDGFINRYVFPDGEVTGPGIVIRAMTAAGFELRHGENLREHYAETLRWWSANLDARWDDAVAEVGEGRARVWRLYLAASRMSFTRNLIGLHQFLGVRLDDHGGSGMPIRPDWERSDADRLR